MEVLDLGSYGFTGLMVIGAVNAVTILFGEMTNQQKLLLSFVVAIAVSFIPVEIGNLIYDKAVVALSVALASSGGYKIAQKVGGIR